MLYPIFSYSDGTEVTASKPNANGKIFLYIEKFDEKKDAFINATLILPGTTIQSSSGYSADELAEIADEYAEIEDDIISYVKGKVKQSA